MWNWSINCVGSFPLQAVLTTLLQPVSKAIQQVQAFREQNRTSPHFNHLSAVSESVPALGWVAMVRPGLCVICVSMQVILCVGEWINERIMAGNKPFFDSVITVWWATVFWLTHRRQRQSCTVWMINSLLLSLCWLLWITHQLYRHAQ